MKYNSKLLCFACLSLTSAFVLCSAKAASVTYFITTDQTGAQTQIDFQHASIWNFTPAGNVDVVGANFSLKNGSQTSADISFFIYQGNYSLTFDGSNNNAVVLPNATAVASKSLSNAAFVAQVSSLGGNADQNWNWHEFLIGTVANPFYTLMGGQPYTAVIYSDASKKGSGTTDAQSYAYFIKDGALVFNQDPTNPTKLSVPPALVPEPSSLSLLSAGLVCLILYRGGRRLVQGQFSKKI